MKAIYSIIFLSILFVSCSKDEDNVSSVVEVSYPTIALKGPAVVNLTVGAAYTDAGATLTDDISGATSDITSTSSSVNTATAGLYIVDFVAANANGYETSVSRVVTVTSVVSTRDISGSYLRPLNGQTCVIAKVANGVYKVTNPGGAAGASDVIIYLVETAPGTYIAPAQPTTVGPFALSSINVTATGFSWVVSNAGYGTAVRTFVKQ